VVHLDAFTTACLMEEYTHPLNAGSVMKAHVKHLFEMTKDRHPFAIMVSRFYGLNGEQRAKRDISEYVI